MPNFRIRTEAWQYHSFNRLQYLKLGTQCRHLKTWWQQRPYTSFLLPKKLKHSHPKRRSSSRNQDQTESHGLSYQMIGFKTELKLYHSFILWLKYPHISGYKKPSVGSWTMFSKILQHKIQGGTEDMASNLFTKDLELLCVSKPNLIAKSLWLLLRLLWLLWTELLVIPITSEYWGLLGRGFPEADFLHRGIQMSIYPSYLPNEVPDSRQRFVFPKELFLSREGYLIWSC